MTAMPGGWKQLSHATQLPNHARAMELYKELKGKQVSPSWHLATVSVMQAHIEDLEARLKRLEEVHGNS